MELKHLRTFVEIMKTGSFSGAAKKLDYAQSTITGHIHLLEGSLSVKLFERTGNVNSPTREAEILLPYARKILASTDEAMNVIRGVSEQMVGEIILGTTQSVSVTNLVDALRAFSRDFPGIELNVKNVDCRDVAHKLKQGEIDLAFVTCQPIRDSSILIRSERPEEMVLGFSKKEYSREEVERKDFRSERFIVNWKGCIYRTFLEKHFEEWGGSPRLMEVDSVQAMKDLCAGGFGLAYLPGYVLEKEKERGSLDYIDLDPLEGEEVVTQLLLHRKKTVTPAMSVLCNEISAVLND